MARLEEDINPEILGWARERAGLSLEKAAKKIGLSSSKKETAAQKLTKMEDGASKPTRRQLYKIAKSYWYPVAIFYLDNLPMESKKGVDFRSSSDSEQKDTEEEKEKRGRLDALVRNVYARQGTVKGILEEDEDEEPRSFVGSLKDTSDISVAVEAIKKSLDLHDDRTLDFNELRERVHGIGVFVLLIGDLGNYHTTIEASVFRGFAIADPIAPFIVINPQDSSKALSFTLLHELVHIFLGSSGISGNPNSEPSQKKIGQIEKFCNDVASHILLPHKFLSGIKALDDDDMKTARKIIETLAQKYKVSHSMVAYRLYRENLIEKEIYKSLHKFYKNLWKEQNKQKKQSQKRKGDGGPSFYVIRGKRIGSLLKDFVKRSLITNEITYTKAGKILDVKAVSVRTFLEYRKHQN